MEIEFPKKLAFLAEPHRYKVLWGGRGGIKSWSIARHLLIDGAARSLRVGCGRETMESIKDSVHQLLKDQINLLGLSGSYDIGRAEIKGKNGTLFTFHGLRELGVHNIKSLEGIDRFWVEEAQNVTKSSWMTLIPTIRKPKSEIWVSFNPVLDTDDTYKRFVTAPPPGAVVVKTGYRDNAYLSDELRAEIQHLRITDPDEFEHVYEGVCKQTVEGAVYKNELLSAEKEGRICRVPWEPSKPVDTFWDLGFFDSVAIWFAQSIGFEFRFIDFMQGSQQSLQYYLKALQERPYIYGSDYLPWDGATPSLQTGRSIRDQLAAAGRKVWTNQQLKVEQGIQAARAIFPKCWFDAERCADGIQALRHYRYEVKEQLGTLSKAPVHDWASHAADAFRTAAMAIREPERKQQSSEWGELGNFGGAGWMA